MIACNRPGYGGPGIWRDVGFWMAVGTTGRPGHTEESDVREARPPTLQIDRDRDRSALSAISTRETTVPMVSRLFEKPRVHWVLS